MKTHVLTILALLIALPFPAAAEWWHALSDSTLNSLEERALAANYDLDVALRRVEIARAQLAEARSAYYPTVGVSAGWEKERRTLSALTLGANMSWEVDLFGRVRANANQNKAQVRASRADLEGTQLSVTASVAETYVNLRAAQANLQLAREQAADRKKVADMVQARYDAGLADRLDVAQSLTTYYSTCASMPPLNTAVVQSVSALAVLLGAQPADLAPELDSQDPVLLPGPVLLPDSVPVDDIRNRPDIIAAEAKIDAAAAALGIARKEYLPKLTVTGSIATAGHRIDNLFSDESFTWQVAPTLSWTVFDGLSRRANVKIAREEMEIAVAQYNDALLSGFAEVRNALTDYSNSLRTVEFLSKTVEQTAIALDKSITLYKLNLTGFTSVVQSQNDELSYRTSLIQQHANIITSYINFHKAIGH